MRGSQIASSSRGCLGSFLSNGCGCLAFLGGAGLAVALFGAHLLSGWGERAIEGWLNSIVDGDVAVSGVDLSWRDRQSVDSITIDSPDGDMVIQAEVKLPSLLDLVGFGERGEDGKLSEPRLYEVTINNLTSIVEADGTSDLGRTFGLVADDGRSVVEALQERVAQSMAQIQPDDDEGPVRVELSIDSGMIDDSASGRDSIRIEDFELVATADREGVHFDLQEFALVGQGLEGRAEVDAELHYHFDPEGRLRLTEAHVDAPPLPGGVLQTLGLAPRSEASPSLADRPRRRDLVDLAGQHGVAALASVLDDGAAVRANFRTPEDGGAPRLSVALTAEQFELELQAVLLNDVLVPADRSSDRAPLYARFEPDAEGIASLFAAMLPATIVPEARADGATWLLESRSFRLPLDSSELVIGDGGPVDERPFSERVAAWLRRSEIVADLRDVGNERTHIRFAGQPDEGGAPRPGVDWAHRITTVQLSAELGGTIESLWHSVQGRGSRLSSISVTIPGRALIPGDEPFARLDLALPDLDTELVVDAIGIPEELRVLLPSRLYKLDVRGVPVQRFIRPGGNERWSASVDVWTAEDLRFRGRFEDGRLTVPSAELTLPVGDDVCELILERLLPWLAEVEPLEADSRMRIEMRDFSFAMSSRELRERADATLECPPLRVRLQPRLAAQFRLEDPSDWIEWTPRPIELALEANLVRYRSVELPLGDDVEPSTMSGSFDRDERELSLSGIVQGSSLPRFGEFDLAPVNVVIKGPPDSLGLSARLDLIDSMVDGVLDRLRTARDG